ncbi:AraC family transcriptional regulator [Bittarella massiliensis (ex Durand et al. 2017)]|uniref:AraC family transcriptional regulator n=1 Tax=Bittarella massiliensis (ex Durand et al. 2017) TaxID=1720313 RepID=UPI001AA14795|nr:AraC family transcriptional regulator [Bittarella massiliensis (ex Durand et al. 2017)]MBO1680301.1 AraC family transcriptional regulator [Bittarella massiliensis (ex Durand et al. 2017)]
MEWIEQLNLAVRYIEEHLAGELDLEEAAKVACCSSYHFQRMFSYLAGVPLSEYVRRRRMSLAAVDLCRGEETVLDIALRYGYASPTAFNRAFQGVHGIAPSLAKKGGAPLKSYPPVSFKITVKGVEEMNYRIEERGPIRILGISAPLHREIQQNFAVVPQMWERAAADGTIPRLAALMDTPPMGLLGVSACGDGEEWCYFIAVSSSQPAPAGLEEYTIPAFTWAVFLGGGTGRSIQELEQRIVTEWLPTSGYEYADGPDVEVYLNPDPQNTQYEVWIPVIKKEFPRG